MFFKKHIQQHPYELFYVSHCITTVNALHVTILLSCALVFWQKVNLFNLNFTQKRNFW